MDQVGTIAFFGAIGVALFADRQASKPTKRSKPHGWIPPAPGVEPYHGVSAQSSAGAATTEFVTRMQRTGGSLVPQGQYPPVAGGFAKYSTAANQYTVQVLDLTESEKTYLTYLGRKHGIEIAIMGADPVSVTFRAR